MKKCLMFLIIFTFLPLFAFVEEKERQLQLSKLTAEQAKSDVVKSILDELERVSADENQ